MAYLGMVPLRLSPGQFRKQPAGLIPGRADQIRSSVSGFRNQGASAYGRVARQFQSVPWYVAATRQQESDRRIHCRHTQVRAPLPIRVSEIPPHQVCTLVRAMLYPQKECPAFDL